MEINVKSLFTFPAFPSASVPSMFNAEKKEIGDNVITESLMTTEIFSYSGDGEFICILNYNFLISAQGETTSSSSSATKRKNSVSSGEKCP